MNINDNLCLTCNRKETCKDAVKTGIMVQCSEWEGKEKRQMTKGEVVESAFEQFQRHFRTQFMLDLFRYCYGKGYEAGNMNVLYTEEDIDNAYQRGYEKGMQDALQNTEAPNTAIEVGDEVTAEDGTAKFYVTWLTDYEVSGIDEGGRTFTYTRDEIVGKTGEHLDIVEWMRNDRSFAMQ